MQLVCAKSLDLEAHRWPRSAVSLLAPSTQHRAPARRVEATSKGYRGTADKRRAAMLKLTTAPALAFSPPTPRPNVVFLVVESTDGRTWQRGYQNSVIPLRDQGTALPATERYLTSATSLHWVARC